MCVDIHLGVADTADAFYTELRRKWVARVRACVRASVCVHAAACVPQVGVVSPAQACTRKGGSAGAGGRAQHSRQRCARAAGPHARCAPPPFRYYVTPKSYLDLIHLYISLLRETRQVRTAAARSAALRGDKARRVPHMMCGSWCAAGANTHPHAHTHAHTQHPHARARAQEMGLARDRLLNGLDKLQETNTVVDRMQRELNELQPVLAEKTVDTQKLLVQVGRGVRACCVCVAVCCMRPYAVRPSAMWWWRRRTHACICTHNYTLTCARAQVDTERTDAEAIRHVVVEEEVEVKLKQAETQVLKDDAQKDLEHVGGTARARVLLCVCVGGGG